MEYEVTIGLFLMVLCGQCSRPDVQKEYCDTETFEPKCPDGEVIMMKYAKYGRMKLARCVTIDLGYLGCNSDVLSIADRRCSGRQTCTIRIPDPDLENTRPCLKELKSYLEATYSCIPAMTNTNCTEEGTNLTSSVGWLSSSVAMDTGCGAKESPWMISVDPGQRINITLYDFSVERTYHVSRIDDFRNNDRNFEIEPTICREYAIIYEIDTEWNTMVCGGTTRVQHVYLSKSNNLRIEFTNGGQKIFMLKYEAIGCPDRTAPVNGWFKRTETGATIGCTHSHDEWRLSCSGSSWVGHVGNCSAPAQTAFIDDHPSYGISLPLGASIAIIIGAALGVGLVVVVIGLIRFRRHRNYETPHGEAIVLEEKVPVSGVSLPRSDLQHQPLPPVPTSGVVSAPDSGHCSMDAEPGAMALPPGTPGVPGTPTTPGTPTRPLMHHQRTIRINGNEYAHIWECPLPDPKGTRPKGQGPGFQPTCRLEITRDPSGKNTFYTCTRYSPQLVGRNAQWAGYHHHHLCPDGSRSLTRPTPGTSTGRPGTSVDTHGRGGTSSFCSPNASPSASPSSSKTGGGVSSSPKRHPQIAPHHQHDQIAEVAAAASFSSSRPGEGGGVTCGVVRHIPTSEFNDGGPRYSTLERKPGYGNNNSSSSSV